MQYLKKIKLKFSKIKCQSWSMHIILAFLGLDVHVNDFKIKILIV